MVLFTRNHRVTRDCPYELGKKSINSNGRDLFDIHYLLKKESSSLHSSVLIKFLTPCSTQTPFLNVRFLLAPCVSNSINCVMSSDGWNILRFRHFHGFLSKRAYFSYFVEHLKVHTSLHNGSIWTQTVQKEVLIHKLQHKALQKFLRKSKNVCVKIRSVQYYELMKSLMN